jgi:hypothetical protein
MQRAPLSRAEFEEKNRRILAGDPLPDREVRTWELGRDWLAELLAEELPGQVRRRSPRARVSVLAYLAGVGGAITEDLGFFGLGLRSKQEAGLRRGTEASVRLTLFGRSVYVLGRVAWAQEDRLGLAIGAAHPDDQRAIQAAVCNRLLDRWVET